MFPQISLIDTRIDTTNFIVPMTITFKKRSYINSEGLSPIYLNVSSQNKRKRIQLDIFVNPKLWDKKTSRLKGPAEITHDTNLILDNIYSKITKIKTTYILSSKVLTIDSFMDEFNNEMPRANFVSFFKRILDERKKSIHPNTHRKEKAIYQKLKNFKDELLFCDIDLVFFMTYRSHLSSLGNGRVTRNNNIKIIKKYLRYATKIGVKLQIDLDDIKPGSTKGNRDYLNTKEVEACYKYFNSEWIKPSYKLVLGYFLFSCFTGLRISDVKQIKRRYIKNNKYTLKNVKGDKTQVINLNEKAMHVILNEQRLFDSFFSEKHINETLKEIMNVLGVNKHVSFHVARHTFATNLIILGCPITEVQKLLNHSDIKDTMIYVHMAEQETNKNSDILNNWF